MKTPPRALATTLLNSARRAGDAAFARGKSGRLYLLIALLSFASSAIVAGFIPRYVPRVHDEFAYLLAGQTFARLELTNPSPPLWPFFETQHILVQPSYMAKYLPGQGLMLAVGYWLGHPILGVWIESALLAVSVAWMVRGFLPARWALFGGLLTIVQVGVTYYWAQSYWGGALAATGGALVFGGTRRVWRNDCLRDSLLLGAGIVILLLTRPFEGGLVCVVPAVLVIASCLRSRRDPARHPVRRLLLPCGLVVAAGLGFLAYYNVRVTGSPLQLPYLEYEHQYSGSPTFVWQKARPEPAFSNPVLQDYYREYVVALSRFYAAPWQVFGTRLRINTENFLGYLLAPFALLALVLRPSRWTLLAALSLLSCALAMVFSFWFSSHYQSPAAPLYFLLAVVGVRSASLRWPSTRRKTGLIFVVVLAAQALALSHHPPVERDLAYYRNPDRRQKIIDALVDAGGQHLVFVRMLPPYYHHLSWVFNEARLERSPIIWAWGPRFGRK